MSLRVLIVEGDTARAERLSNVLESAQCDVLPLQDFKDASEALQMQHFDAVLIPSAKVDAELQVFAAKLRALEKSSRQGMPTAIVAYGGQSENPAVDAVLPDDFAASTFSAAMSRLGQRVSRSGAGLSAPASEPLFDEAQFREQMCNDDELMAEIIDLYLVESAKQREQMKTAIDGNDLASLSRLAHTIKGSLGSLHTPLARSRAQELEIAAKHGETAASASALAALEIDLQATNAVLLSFRNR